MRISLHPRAAASLPRSRNARKLEEKKLNVNDSFYDRFSTMVHYVCSWGYVSDQFRGCLVVAMGEP